MPKNQEFLYVGYYVDTEGNYILKIGKTIDPARREKQHTYTYRKLKKHALPAEGKFYMLWSKPLARYTAEKYEDANRERWKSEGWGQFITKDRFLCNCPPEVVKITIKKTYEIAVV